MAFLDETGLAEVWSITKAKAMPTKETAALFGLGEGATVDAVLGQLGKHWWSRRTKTSTYSKCDPAVMKVHTTSGNKTFYRSTKVTITNGIVALSNPEAITIKSYTNVSTFNANIPGYYFAFETTGKYEVYYVDSTVTATYDSSGMSASVQRVVVVNNYGDCEYLCASDSSAYPIGNANGYEYCYLGTPFDNARNGAKIQTGSYVGTGAYGAGGKCTLTFNFEPKFVMVFSSSMGQLTGAAGSNTGVSYTIIAARPATSASHFYTTINYDYFEWEGNTFSWYSSGTYASSSSQLNYVGSTYYYLAIG